MTTCDLLARPGRSTRSPSSPCVAALAAFTRARGRGASRRRARVARGRAVALSSSRSRRRSACSPRLPLQRAHAAAPAARARRAAARCCSALRAGAARTARRAGGAAPRSSPWLLGVGAMWLWHAPTLCNAAAHERRRARAPGRSRCSRWAPAFWWPILAPRARARLTAAARRSSTSSPPASRARVLGILVTFSPVEVCPVFAHPVDALGVVPLVREAGALTAETDQQIGGLLMWVPACLVYGGGILGDARALLRATSRRRRPRDGARSDAASRAEPTGPKPRPERHPARRRPWPRGAARSASRCFAGASSRRRSCSAPAASLFGAVARSAGSESMRHERRAGDDTADAADAANDDAPRATTTATPTTARDARVARAPPLPRR